MSTPYSLPVKGSVERNGMLSLDKRSVRCEYPSGRVESGRAGDVFTLDSGQRMFVKIGVQESAPKNPSKIDQTYHMGKTCQNPSKLLKTILAGRAGPTSGPAGYDFLSLDSTTHTHFARAKMLHFVLNSYFVTRSWRIFQNRM